MGVRGHEGNLKPNKDTPGFGSKVPKKTPFVTFSRPGPNFLSQLEKHPVVNVEIAGLAYAVFAKPGMISPLDSESIHDARPIPAAAAFERRIDGRVLEFKAENGQIVDRSTGSTWNILGEAASGPLKGRRLAPIAESSVHFAFAWLAFNPGSEVVRALLP